VANLYLVGMFMAATIGALVGCSAVSSASAGAILRIYGPGGLPPFSPIEMDRAKSLSGHF
jgi:hypothetical protein